MKLMKIVSFTKKNLQTKIQLHQLNKLSQLFVGVVALDTI
jgi:hypothetical protein